MDGDVGSQGTIVLDADGIHTEFDSMQYAIDGIEGLVRQRHMSSEPEESTAAEEPEADEEKVDYASLSADDLANEVDYYLRNNYPGANWVSDKELSDGSLALMIDWGNNNVEEIKPALKSQFGDRISFINTPPEAGGVGIIVNALERTPVNEAIDFDNEFGNYYSDLRYEEDEQDAEAENYQEMTEEGVQGVLNKLGLTVVNKWYDGNRSRPVFDCQKGNGETICVWTEPPYEAKVWFKDREPGNNRFTEDIITLDSLESELNDLLDEISPTEEELNAAAEKISAPDYHAEGAYEDLTDIGGDFESIGNTQISSLMESVNADSFSYETYVTKHDKYSIVQVYAHSKNTEWLEWIFDYFGLICNEDFKYQLDDITWIMSVSGNYERRAINAIPYTFIGVKMVTSPETDESTIETTVLDKVKHFINQAIESESANRSQGILDNKKFFNFAPSRFEDDPREFAYDEAVELYKDIKAICDIAGKPALAEAVIKLHKAYHPVLEAAEVKPHVIPKEIAIAVNNAQAEDYGWRPETTEHAFEGTWDWLEDHADTVLDAWNATNDPREVIQAVEGDEEQLACMFDGI
jgi:hypothetical protein